MLTGSELETAIAAVLIGAVCLGFVLHWLWLLPRGGTPGDGTRLDEMAERLHEADLAREAADEARREAVSQRARREAETAGRLAAMQSRLDGVVEGREAELSRKLSAALSELETMSGGLRDARQRTIDLEAEIEELRGENG